MPRSSTSRSVMRERKRHKESCSKRLGDYFKTIDVYGEKISLTYKGEESFKTYPGAITSLLILSLVLLYGVFRSYLLIYRVDPDVSKKSFQRDLSVADQYRP